MNSDLTVYLDPLTGLFSRPTFTIVAEKYLKLSRRVQHGLVLIVLDLDGLEQINARHGRAEGDWALQQVAEVLQHQFRESDVMGRLDDDEFAFLAMGVRDKDADALAARLNEGLAQATAAAGRPYTLSVSAGLAGYNPDIAQSLDELIAQAKAALEAHRQRKRGA